MRRPARNYLPTRWGRLLILGVAACFSAGCVAHSNQHLPESSVSTGDSAFLLVSAALVMLMTPALALFYGGLVRAKNVLSVIMQCFVALGVITLQWYLVGYSLSFAPSLVRIGEYGILGSLNWFGGRGVGMTPYEPYSATIPHRLFMVYQCMFAVITPALIAGAFAERMKFSAYVLFILLWTTLVYDPVAHWVWSENGWLKKIGSLDFAGGAVVHMTSGLTALVAALMIGPRRGFPRTAFLPHSLVFTVFGAGLLWFGWFGFNGGSALASGALATAAFVATHCGAAGGAVAWLLVDWLFKQKPTALGFASGAVAGLVAITPASGYVGPLSAFVIGAVAGIVCSWVVSWRARAGIDDALDAFGVHGVGGTLGALLTGVFASAWINPAIAGNEGLIHGGFRLIVTQLVAVVAVAAYTFLMSFIVLKAVDLTIGLRVPDEEEKMGLDLTEHGESAYSA
ncbi:MAG: ammonium transporter [Candidatus Hydrogenedentota bacterium]|nr:MAG: ammonium transporter [Candidatus Hydrogenedentota bacterium]